MRNQLDGTEDICADADGVTKEEVATMVNLGNAKVTSITYNSTSGAVTALTITSNTFTVTYNGTTFSVSK